MPKIPGINHLQAVRALEKAGFRIVRQGKHVVMVGRHAHPHHPASQSCERHHDGRYREGGGING